MNLLELKKAVDNAIEMADEYGPITEDINVSIQIDGHNNFSVWGSDVELYYDNNGCASGCVLSASYEAHEGSLNTLHTSEHHKHSAFLPMESAPRVEGEKNPILLKFKEDLSPYYGNFPRSLKRWEGQFIVASFDGFDLDKDDFFNTFGIVGGAGGLHSDWFEGWKSLSDLDTSDKE